MALPPGFHVPSAVDIVEHLDGSAFESRVALETALGSFVRAEYQQQLSEPQAVYLTEHYLSDELFSNLGANRTDFHEQAPRRTSSTMALSASVLTEIDTQAGIQQSVPTTQETDLDMADLTLDSGDERSVSEKVRHLLRLLAGFGSTSSKLSRKPAQPRSSKSPLISILDRPTNKGVLPDY